jgi:hypothetical protein
MWPPCGAQLIAKLAEDASLDYRIAHDVRSASTTAHLFLEGVPVGAPSCFPTRVTCARPRYAGHMQGDVKRRLAERWFALRGRPPAVPVPQEPTGRRSAPSLNAEAGIFLGLSPQDLSEPEDDRQKARRVFFSYACNHFHLDRDGMLPEYEKLGVTAQDEQEWRREFVEHWTARLSVDDMTPLERLDLADAHEALPRLMAMAEKGDSFARLWFANVIWHLASSMGQTAYLQPRREQQRRIRDAKRAGKCAVRLYRSIISTKTWVTEEHRDYVAPYLAYFDATTAEEYILAYAARKLHETSLHPR